MKQEPSIGKNDNINNQSQIKLPSESRLEFYKGVVGKSGAQGRNKREVTKHIRVSGKESFICVGGTSMTSFGAWWQPASLLAPDKVMSPCLPIVILQMCICSDLESRELDKMLVETDQRMI